MSRRALIGHTGFVGGNLLRQADFDARFNSRNIEQLAGEKFESVVCAGAPAAKWLANRDPAQDRQSLERLMAALERVQCERFVLISTIDVYPKLQAADEAFDCEQATNHAYGTHRSWLEQRVRARFPDALIVRLPALFGPGLKKNVLYDLLHDQQLAAINPRSTFQWYGLSHLWQDIQIARRQGLPLVNLFTEPLATAEIVRLFPEQSHAIGIDPGPELHYALTTRHAELFGAAPGSRFVQSAEQVLREIAEFVREQRALGAA
jgi:hypothetical protein